MHSVSSAGATGPPGVKIEVKTEVNTGVNKTDVKMESSSSKPGLSHARTNPLNSVNNDVVDWDAIDQHDEAMGFEHFIENPAPNISTSTASSVDKSHWPDQIQGSIHNVVRPYFARQDLRGMLATAHYKCRQIYEGINAVPPTTSGKLSSDIL